MDGFRFSLKCYGYLDPVHKNTKWHREYLKMEDAPHSEAFVGNKLPRSPIIVMHFSLCHQKTFLSVVSSSVVNTSGWFEWQVEAYQWSFTQHIFHVDWVSSNLCTGWCLKEPGRQPSKINHQKEGFRSPDVSSNSTFQFGWELWRADTCFKMVHRQTSN